MSFRVRRLRESERRSDVWRRVCLATVLLSRPVAAWYGAWRKRHEREKKREHRIHLLKRLLTVLIALLVALLLLALTAKALVSMRLLGIDTLFSVASTTPMSSAEGHINFLLMGQGDKDHDGQDLTDTIIVASIDPLKTQSVVLLSLPRDLYFLQTEKMGKGKLNSMYRDYKSTLQFRRGMDKRDAAIETLKELKDEIGRNIGAPIHYAVKVDFSAFVKAVDLLKGVDIDVPYDIIDVEYPDENYGYEPFNLQRGMRHFDGALALKYARSRSTTSDFDRSARQQQLLTALVEKVKEKKLYNDPKIIAEITSLMLEHVEMTGNVREMIGLAKVLKDIEPSRVISMQLSDRNGLYDEIILPGGFLYAPPRDLFDGHAVLLPVSIPEFPVTWRQIQTLVQLLFSSRSFYLEKPIFSVLNAGGTSGLARKLGNELTKYGFSVERIANATLPKQETSLIASGNAADGVIVRFFSTLLKIPEGPLPDALPLGEQSRVTIILGKDFVFTPLQNMLPENE